MKTTKSIEKLERFSSDNIPAYRKQFMKVKLSQFISDYPITQWPIDCTKIIETIQNSHSISLQIGTVSSVSNSFDAVSRYVSKENTYQIIFNSNKINYPFSCSKDRRMNFTIAHELGHIFLEHLLIDDELKSDDMRHIEELEANEFAGRLLMPEKVIFNCNFNSLYAAAEYFNVSLSALSARIHALKRLDLLDSRQSTICKTCGNSEISYGAKHCRICGGKWESNNDGILRIVYNGISVNSNGEAYYCPNCGYESDCFLSSNCSKCGSELVNKCTNKASCSHHNHGNSKYCEFCGSKTNFLSFGYLRPWDEDRSLILSEILGG